MANTDSFIAELEARNQSTVEKLVDAYMETVASENLSMADAAKLEIKCVIEDIEFSALWLADTDGLAFKLALAERCGRGADHHRQLAERLQGLGIAVDNFDPRDGGYSKLFAFLRSLQTPPERLAAGFLTLAQMNICRLAALAGHCETRNDAGMASLLRDKLLTDAHLTARWGRQQLETEVANEEGQARARRSAYRTIELLAERQEPLFIRKFLRRSRLRDEGSAAL